MLDQDLIGGTVPDAGPGLIGPAQAEREVWLSRAEDLIDRAFQQPKASQPIVIITESFDSVFLGETGLRGPCLWEPEIVETKIGRQIGLTMPSEKWLGLYGIGPFGKPFSPPFIVFWNRMVLR